jgi:hypothetical protein
MGEQWDSKKNMVQKRAADRMRGEAYGKGDKPRTNLQGDSFQLGMKLIKDAEKYGKDSDEYRNTLEAWKKAVKEGR